MSFKNMATARTAALSRTADEDTYPSFMRIATSPINSKFLSQQPNVPTFGYITIKDGTTVVRDIHFRKL